MSDIISRGKLLGVIEPMVGIWYDETFWIDYKRVIDIIENEPSAKPKERTAKVEKVDTNSPHSQVYKCCKCGQYTHRTAWSRDVHYCPSCGARLEWE